MLYRPNFCCQCSNKIERIEWKFWTSRKFCENCEKDFRKEEWLPRFIAGFSVLIGVFGIGSYLKTPEKPLNMMANQVVLNSSNKTQNLKNEAVLTNVGNQNLSQNRTVTANTNSLTKPTEQITRNRQTVPSLKSNGIETAPTINEQSFYCGAQTKKGTSCTRRVKGGGRCWQHQGQPAILPKNKLVINQN